MALFRITISDSKAQYQSDRWTYHVESTTAIHAISKAYRQHQRDVPEGGALTVWRLKRLTDEKVVR